MEFILPHKFAFCEATTLKSDATYAGLSVRSGMKQELPAEYHHAPQSRERCGTAGRGEGPRAATAPWLER